MTRKKPEDQKMPRNLRGWDDGDSEKLISWMEENRGIINGPPLIWATKAKDTIFKKNHTVDTNKLRSKYYNMKYAWMNAKTMQTKLNFGKTPEECSDEMNGKSKRFL